MRHIIFCLSLLALSILLSSCDHKLPFGKEFTQKTPQAVLDACRTENPQLSSAQCDIKACLTDPFLLLGMESLLNYTNAVLQDLQIPYWLDSGTLLGSMRFHAPLPWDDDDDIAVLAKDIEPKLLMLEKRLVQDGYVFSTVYGGVRSAFKHQPEFWKISFSKSSYAKLLLQVNPALSLQDIESAWEDYTLWQNPTLDIFPMDEVGDKLIIRPDAFRKQTGSGFPIDTVLPLTVGPFLNAKLPLPSDSVAYSAIWYHTQSIQTDFVIQSLHSNACRQAIRFRDVRKIPELLNYFDDYLRFVFGDRYKGNAIITPASPQS